MSRARPTIAHLTTVDLSLRYLLLPQLTAPLEKGVRSVGISAPGPWVADLEAFGVEHLPLRRSTRGFSLGSDLRSAWDLWRLLRRTRPDILHTHNPKPGIYGRVVGRLAGVPVVVNTVHGLYATESDRWPKRALIYGLEWVASRFSDAELVQNPEDHRFLRRTRIVPDHKLVMLGNGVDLARFDPGRFDAGTRTAAREAMGVDDDRIVVGMVGRLVVEKGYLELFEAAGLLDDRFAIVCIGPDDPDKTDGLSPQVMARAEANGVRFLGMRSDVDVLYSGMDVFALPSHREGFPRAAMEAAAMGLPVVATDIRGCRQVVDDGVNGFLVPLGDGTALARALWRLGDEQTRRNQGRAGAERARRLFDERAVVGTVMDVYRRSARTADLRHLSAALASGEEGEIRIREAAIGDSAFMAGLHRSAIASGFLSSLGPGFLGILYRAIIADSGSVALVAEDDSGPIGFVAGTSNTGAFYRRFVRRHGPSATMAAASSLVRPSNLRLAVETLLYGSGDDSQRAELLSMATVPERRRRGVGARLGEEFLARMSSGGSSQVAVVVGSANRTAIGAYERMGFQRQSTVEVHRGERSELLVWSG